MGSRKLLRVARAAMFPLIVLVALALPTVAAAAPAVPGWVSVYKIDHHVSAYGQGIDTYCYGSPNFTDRASGVWLGVGGQWVCDGFQWSVGVSGTFHRWGRYTWGTKTFEEKFGWTKVGNSATPPGWMTVYSVGQGSAYGQRLDRYCFASPAFTTWPSGFWVSTAYGWMCVGFETMNGSAGSHRRTGMYNYNAQQFFEWHTWSKLP